MKTLKILSKILPISFLLFMGCATSQKEQPVLTNAETAVQSQIDALETEIASLDALIDNTREDMEKFSIADMAKIDLEVTKSEEEIETYKTRRQKLEARLIDLQVEVLSDSTDTGVKLEKSDIE